MDSLERLAHSLEQAIALIHSLRRENRDLKVTAGQAAGLADQAEEASRLASALDDARVEIERLRQEPAVDLQALERAKQAELESAQIAAQLEQQKAGREELKRQFEARIHDLELRLLAAEREEVMPLDQGDKNAEIAALARRCSELEAQLGDTQSLLEKTKGQVTAMQVKLAESAEPDEVNRWVEQIGKLEAELSQLRHLSEIKEGLEMDRAMMKKHKKTVAAITREREQVGRKLDEIYGLLDNLRLT